MSNEKFRVGLVIGHFKRVNQWGPHWEGDIWTKNYKKWEKEPARYLDIPRKCTKSKKALKWEFLDPKGQGAGKKPVFLEQDGSPHSRWN